MSRKRIVDMDLAVADPRGARKRAARRMAAPAGDLRGPAHGVIDVPVLKQLPMTPAYFRQALRHFGDSPDRRAAILAGTGVMEEALQDSFEGISLFQQVRQVDNLVRLFGEGWALRAPELWQPTVHGPLGVAAIAAPNFAAMMETIARFSHVRAPFHATSLRRGRTWSQLEYELTVPLEERVWRPMMEITFLGIRAGIASIFATAPSKARYLFACAEPLHGREVRAVLGEGVVYDAPRNAIQFPSAWLSLASPFADAKLYSIALNELQAAAQRIATPLSLRGRVERLLNTYPTGRLSADDVARLTGVSRRTLVRRLSQAGTSYRQLVDTELRNRAERLLRSGGLSHEWIAEELGYTDPTSFSRACRRWFGRKSPA